MTISASLFSLGRGTSLFVLVTLLATPLPVSVAWAQRHYIQPIPVTAAKLAADYQNNFPLADAKYTGMLLLVTGRVKTITPPQRTYNYQPNKAYTYLTMESGRNSRPLVVYLLAWESEKILKSNYLRSGSQVTVMGFCQGAPPQLSLRDACIYPDGCGGPVPGFGGPYFKLPVDPPLPPLLP